MGTSSIYGDRHRLLSSNCADIDLGPVQEQFLQALMSWQFPEHTLEPALASSLSATKPGQEMMTHRKAAWQEATRCLLGAVRSHACSGFYLVSPPVSVPFWLTSARLCPWAASEFDAA